MDKIAPFPTAETANQKSVMLRMAQRFEMEPRAFEQTLMATIIPGGKATKEQVAAFLVVADRYNLDPFVKEIYAFPDKGGGVRPIVGIDGWLTLINRQPMLDGIEYVDHFEEVDGKRALVAITCIMHRKDRKHPTAVTEYMAECKRNTEPWNRWERRMLRHKVTIQTGRVAFGLGGIFDPDEAERIEEAEEAREVEATVKPTVKPTPTTLEELIPKIVGMPPAAEPPPEPTPDDPGQAFAGWEDPA